MPKFNDSPSPRETYRRRDMPVDIFVESEGRAAPQENATNSAADADRLGNLRRHSDPKFSSAAPPNRKAGNEAGQKP